MHEKLLEYLVHFTKHLLSCSMLQNQFSLMKRGCCIIVIFLFLCILKILSLAGFPQNMFWVLVVQCMSNSTFTLMVELYIWKWMWHVSGHSSSTLASMNCTSESERDMFQAIPPLHWLPWIVHLKVNVTHFRPFLLYIGFHELYIWEWMWHISGHSSSTLASMNCTSESERDMFQAIPPLHWLPWIVHLRVNVTCFRPFLLYIGFHELYIWKWMWHISGHSSSTLASMNCTSESECDTFQAIPPLHWLPWIVHLRVNVTCFRPFLLYIGIHELYIWEWTWHVSGHSSSTLASMNCTYESERDMFQAIPPLHWLPWIVHLRVNVTCFRPFLLYIGFHELYIWEWTWHVSGHSSSTLASTTLTAVDTPTLSMVPSVRSLGMGSRGWVLSLTGTPMCTPRTRCKCPTLCRTLQQPGQTLLPSIPPSVGWTRVSILGKFPNYDIFIQSSSVRLLSKPCQTLICVLC